MYVEYIIDHIYQNERFERVAWIKSLDSYGIFLHTELVISSSSFR